MLFFVALALAAGFCALSRRALLKKPLPFYAGFAVLALLTVFLPLDGWSLWARTNIAGLFLKGYLATALFVIVMVTGALKNGSPLMKALMPVRGELSICAGFLLLGHYVACGLTLLTAAAGGTATAIQIANMALAVLILLVFLPLWITSFSAVRRRMGPKRWKRLQKWAYVFYGLMYVHMMVVALPHALNGSASYVVTAALYTAVFFAYGAARLSKALKKDRLAAPLAAVIAAFALCFGLLLTLAQNARTAAGTEQTAETPAAQTQQAATPDAAVPSAEAAAQTPAGTEQTAGTETTAQTEQAAGYKDGVYQGEAMGYNGNISVQVTIEGGKITDIEILSQQDTEGYFDQALAGIVPEILEAQSTWVDAVTGATTSSWGIMDAVQAALDQAS